MDADNGTPLSFATVTAGENSTLSNQDGAFILQLNHFAGFVYASYIGYRTDSVSCRAVPLEIKLYKLPQALPDVQVKATEDETPYIIMTRLLRSFQKKTHITLGSRAFFRTYTELDSSKPAEYMVGYYNALSSPAGLAEAELKDAWMVLPKDAGVLDMASLDLLNAFHPFSNENQEDALLHVMGNSRQDIEDRYPFPYSPLAITDKNLLKKTYRLQMEYQIPEAGDSLVHLLFSAIDTVNTFSGELYFHSRTLQLDKVILYCNPTDSYSYFVDNGYIMESVFDSATAPIRYVKYRVELGFETVHDTTRLRSEIMDLYYPLYEQYHAHTSLKLFLYDFHSPFTLPIYHAGSWKNDLQRIVFFPYNPYFFAHNQQIAEDQAEKKLQQQFNAIPCFDSRLPHSSLSLVPGHMTPWSAGWSPNPKLLSKIPLPGSRFRINHYVSDKKKAAWDSSFASTLIYLDYDCYADTTVFLSTALLDYDQSYALRDDSMTLGYLHLYLDMARLESDFLLLQARKQFGHHCPGKLEISRLYDLINGANEQDTYNLFCNSNSGQRTIFYPKIRALVASRLAELEMAVH